MLIGRELGEGWLGDVGELENLEDLGGWLRGWEA